MTIQVSLLEAALNDAGLRDALANQGVESITNSVKTQIESAQAAAVTAWREASEAFLGGDSKEAMAKAKAACEAPAKPSDFPGTKAAWLKVWAGRPALDAREYTGEKGKRVNRGVARVSLKAIDGDDGKVIAVRITNIKTGHPERGAHIDLTREQFRANLGYENQTLMQREVWRQVGLGEDEAKVDHNKDAEGCFRGINHRTSQLFN